MGNSDYIELKDKEKKKRKDLCHKLEKNMGEDVDSEALLKYLEDEGFLDLSAPSQEEKKVQYTIVRGNHSDKFIGASYKTGNIIINIKKALMSSVSAFLDVPVVIYGLPAAHPAIRAISLISVLLSIAGFSKIDLSEIASLVLVVIWENRMSSLNMDDVYDIVNEKLKSVERNSLTKADFLAAIKELEEIRCIELKGDKIILQEKIRISY